MRYLPGDTVRCVSDEFSAGYLKKGTNYVVKEHTNVGVRLVDTEDSPIGGWAADRFIPFEKDIHEEVLEALPPKGFQGTKHDAGKPPCELLSPEAMIGTANVLAFGAKKYSANNWRQGIAWSRLTGACLRHLFAFMKGEDLDQETGLPHLDHLACEVMFLQEFYRTRKDLDDRYRAGVSPDADSNNQKVSES